MKQDLTTPPPSFEEARTLRQQARAAGLNPNYWYAVEELRRVKPKTVHEVIFWKHSIAMFCNEDGELEAMENRCAHRQLKLSLGHVEGCRLICEYHGWEYGGKDRPAGVPYDGDRSFPRLALRTYPVKVRYGLIWIFPGDPELAEERQIPEIPELEGPDRWSCVPLRFEWNAHHSMVIDNVSDFTHAHLHRKYKPFEDATLKNFEIVGDNVHLSYDTLVGRGAISGKFVDHKKLNTNHMKLCYEYPYQWSNTDDVIKHYLFVLPINERKSRVFFLFYFKSLKIPIVPIRIPRSAMTLVMRIANRMLIGPLLQEDQFALEAEQEGYENHWDAHPVETNPVVRAFQELTVRKWREHLESPLGVGLANG
ncbi:MAG: Rieske 2Fe-2S domain-containing protein [Rhodobacteraceae bacterium]|nr:Rieske 2Fe-2S domain-containing protein [Paracoccaceae bacterium]